MDQVSTQTPPIKSAGRRVQLVSDIMVRISVLYGKSEICTGKYTFQIVTEAG